MDNKILTIGIPTYNRAKYLDKCLALLFEEFLNYQQYIDIHVSDNCSTDGTEKVIKKYKEAGYDFTYTKQTSNVGMDGNFGFLYEISSTKYFWLLGDDDWIVEGTIKKILDILQKDIVGLLYLNNYWYEEDLPSNISISDTANLTVYNNGHEFISRITYWVTFLSAFIVNKDLVKNKINIKEYDNTLFTQLSWVITAIYSGSEIVVLENFALLCKGSNSGGYKVFKVFGNNLNKVMDILIRQKLADKRMKHLINVALLKSFFPMFLSSSNFNSENYLKSLLPNFWYYPLFWKKYVLVELKKMAFSSKKL